MDDGHASATTGGSRAAKKRARAKNKKRKEQQRKQKTSADDEQPIDGHATEEQDENHKPAIGSTRRDDDGNGDRATGAKPNADANPTETKKNKTKKKKRRKVVDFATGTDFSPAESSESRAIEELLRRGGDALTLSRIVHPSSKNDDDDDENLETTSLTTEERARVLLASLLRPAATLDRFYGEYFERKPLLVSAPSPSDGEDDDASAARVARHRARLDGLLSKAEVMRLLSAHSLRYGRDVNVTNYVRSTANAGGGGDGEKRRVTLDLLPDDDTKDDDDDDDRFVVADVADVRANAEESGCTVRLLCPQKYVDAVHATLSLLEHEFGCVVGANAYLTPGNGAQGFAPHHDDVDVFVLQLEGRKRWRIHEPMGGFLLPRTSSSDFTSKDLRDGEARFHSEVDLAPGDVLYLPRGWIHQARTLPKNESLKTNNDSDGHSLHLTVSVMQNWSWIDLLEQVVPQALANCAAAESREFREGLPRNFLNYTGLMHRDAEREKENSETRKDNDEANDDDDDEKLPQEARDFLNGDEDDEDAETKRRLRARFREEAKRRILRVCREAITAVDDGCDRLAERFASERLPPALAEHEAELTVDGGRGRVGADTLCRAVRPGVARVTVETTTTNDDDDRPKVVLLHCVDNAREHGGAPLSPMEFEIDDAPALETLLTTVEPRWVRVSDLAHDSGDVEEKIGVAKALYDEGVLAIWNPD